MVLKNKRLNINLIKKQNINSKSYLSDNLIHLKTKHSWHLVDPSPWPFVTSLAVFIFFTGNVMYLHRYLGGKELVLTGLFAILTVMYMWWRDIVREATFEDQHTVSVQRGLRLGMILFIVSEVMFFFAFFWAFFHSSLVPSPSIGGVWPPTSIQPIDAFGIPLTNTFLLLSSGVTVTWAHHAITSRYKKQAVVSLLLTIVLAIVFTLLQVLEYCDSLFSLSDGIFGSCFYMATGFHGFHVFIGTVCLFVSLIRLVLNHYTSTHHFGFESAAWYWHFVDVVWLFLFVAVYWWGGSH